MQVLDEQQHGPLPRQGRRDFQQEVERSRTLEPGRELEHRMLDVDGNRHQIRHQRHGRRVGQRQRSQRGLELVLPIRRRVHRREAAPPREHPRDGVERAVLVVGRTVAFQDDAVIVSNMFLERPEQRGLSDAGFAAQHHDLPCPAAGLAPAIEQRGHLVAPPNQHGGLSVGDLLRPGTGVMLSEDFIRAHGLGHAGERHLAEVA